MLVKHWYQKRLTWLSFLLLPLVPLYALLSQRKSRRDKWQATPFRCPVVVIGNITVGGTGKTPFIIYLARLLEEQNYRVGIVSRGYGGQSTHYPLLVNEHTSASECGDEPRLIADAAHVAVAVSPCRTQAVHTLLQCHGPDIVLSDDGLQHYKMHRDYEIVLLDAQRSWGNGHVLPAGPLREPVSRLQSVNRVYIKQAGKQKNAELDGFPSFTFNECQLLPVTHTDRVLDSKQVVHAVAGIANPEPFFQQLETMGYSICRHVFTDHHQFAIEDFLKFRDSLIVMTEKDWVKCYSLNLQHVWVMRISVKLDFEQEQQLLDDMHHLIKASRTEKTV